MSKKSGQPAQPAKPSPAEKLGQCFIFAAEQARMSKCADLGVGAKSKNDMAYTTTEKHSCGTIKTRQDLFRVGLNGVQEQIHDIAGVLDRLCVENTKLEKEVATIQTENDKLAAAATIAEVGASLAQEALKKETERLRKSMDEAGELLKRHEHTIVDLAEEAKGSKEAVSDLSSELMRSKKTCDYQREKLMELNVTINAMTKERIALECEHTACVATLTKNCDEALERAKAFGRRNEVTKHVVVSRVLHKVALGPVMRLAFERMKEPYMRLAYDTVADSKGALFQVAASIVPGYVPFQTSIVDDYVHVFTEDVREKVTNGVHQLLMTNAFALVSCAVKTIDVGHNMIPEVCAWLINDAWCAHWQGHGHAVDVEALMHSLRLLSAALRSEMRNRAVVKSISAYIIERAAALNREEANRLAQAQLMMQDSSSSERGDGQRIKMIEP